MTSSDLVYEHPPIAQASLASTALSTSLQSHKSITQRGIRADKAGSKV